MSNPFFEKPILNSPYGYPRRHWELDSTGQPTQHILETRRSAEFITPIPKPKKQKGGGKQTSLLFDEGLSTQEQQYHSAIINGVRAEVDKWRALKNPNDWKVTPETARLLQHWRHHNFAGVRPFFCQVEAVETAIWLTEVAPQIGKAGERFIQHLESANHEANPELMRLALKLATGAGKTTVMAMLIAWQTVNAVRRPNSKKFTRGFLLVAPGLTIRDRLRVLQPNDPDSYYASRELVPGDMLSDLERAKIVITNYHSFKLRERIELSKGVLVQVCVQAFYKRPRIEVDRDPTPREMYVPLQQIYDRRMQPRKVPRPPGKNSLRVSNRKPPISDGYAQEKCQFEVHFVNAFGNADVGRIWVSQVAPSTTGWGAFTF